MSVRILQKNFGSHASCSLLGPIFFLLLCNSPVLCTDLSYETDYIIFKSKDMKTNK